jgi:tetratricopeptide (TPR) repeat protein
LPIARDFALGDICLLDMRNQSQPAQPSNTVARAALTILLLSLALTFGCANDAIEANRRQVEANQALIEQTQRQIAMLQSQQGSEPPPSASGPPAACDKKVEATATRRAGDAYAAGNMNQALGYYQDALTACPSSSKAALNLARTDETMNNRETAIRYYRQAAASNDADAHSIEDAKTALSRLGAN